MELKGRTISVIVSDESQPPEARRNAVKLAKDIGFDESQANNVAIIASEITTNILRHGGKGELLLSVLDNDTNPSLEILGLDKGRGIADLPRALQDGYSTAGSAGSGLGAIQRLSDEFDVYSQLDKGTCIYSKIWKSKNKPPKSLEGIEIGVVCRPIAGQAECGDAWCVIRTTDRISAMISDGLGHGPNAAEASLEAVRIFEEKQELVPTRKIEAIHGALRKTRGAAVAIAEWNIFGDQLRFVGVGNISAQLVSSQGRHGMVSSNGTVGHELPKLHEFVYSRAKNDCIVIHSDGLSARWDLNNLTYPGLLSKRAALISAILYRDHCRERDDASVLVVKQREIQ